MSLTLLDREYESLRLILRAGGDGLALDDGRVTPAAAIRLSLDGLIRITPAEEGPQRLIVTAVGASVARQ